METEHQESKQRKRRARGSGHLHKMNGCQYWYMSYRDGSGKSRHESTHEVDRRRAESVLRAKLTDADRGTLGPRGAQHVSIKELIEAAFIKFELDGLRSLKRSKRLWTLHLEPRFGRGFRAAKLTSDDVQKYVLAQQRKGLSNSTIRNTLALLRRSFRLGERANPPKVMKVPHFDLPGSYSDNARQIFFTAEEFERLECEAAKVNLAFLTMIRAAHALGWRSGELKSMRVHQFDPVGGIVTLPRSKSKSKEPRQARVTASMRESLRTLAAGRNPDDPLFDVKDFPMVWRKACVAAGLGVFTCKKCGAETTPSGHKRRFRMCPTCGETKTRGELRFTGKIPHDLRRTAARDMVRAGISPTIATATCGWESGEAMLKRYAICDAEQVGFGQDRLEAARKREAEERAAKAAELVTKSLQTEPKTGNLTPPEGASERLVN